MLLNLSLTLVMIRLWSLPTSAPLWVLVSWTDLLNRDLTATWSIWFRCWPSGEVQVYLCTSLWGNMVDVIVRLLDAQKVTKRSPFSFLSHFKPCFPKMPLSPSCLSPTLAFQSPITNSMSCLGTTSSVFCSRYRRYPLSHLLLHWLEHIPVQWLPLYTWSKTWQRWSGRWLVSSSLGTCWHI